MIGDGRGGAGGQMDASPWREGRIGLAIIGLFVFGFLGWAAFVPLDAAVVGQGAVKVSGHNQAIQFRDGGTIAKLNVREGQRVQTGELLVSFGAQDLIAEERALSGLVIELEASRQRLMAEMSGSEIARPESWGTLPIEHKALADTVFERQKQELQARRSAVSSQIAVVGRRRAQIEARSLGYSEEVRALDEQLRLVTEELNATKELAAEGFAPESRVRALERQRAEIQGRRSQVISATHQAQEGVSESELQAVSIRGDRRETQAAELRTADQKLAEILPNLARVRDRIARSELRAPSDGTVVGLRFFNVGAVVQPGEQIMSIVPENSSLVVEARVLPNDADDVVPGAAADVRFLSMEGRNFARVQGKITRISADSFLDERTGMTYFTTQVEVAREELDTLAKRRGQKTLALRPGLPAEIIVTLRKRTALQYLIEPLDQSIWRSFREH
jgi:HlyD family secretion protein